MLTKINEAQKLSSCSSAYTVLVVKDDHGCVFGCATSTAWANIMTVKGFKAMGDAFVFTNAEKKKEEAVRLHLIRQQKLLEEQIVLNRHALYVGWTRPVPSLLAQHQNVHGVGHEDHAHAAHGADTSCTFHIYPTATPGTMAQHVALGKDGLPAQLSAGGGTAYGSSFALTLDGRLEKGQSGPCESFYSPPLCSHLCPVLSHGPTKHSAETSPYHHDAPAHHGLTLHGLGPTLKYNVLDVEAFTFSRQNVGTDLPVHC
jgi:hypothetical protein